jgi:hypothetical protein
MFAGSGFIQTSSYLMPRALFEKQPFRVDTPHDDWDFLVRLSEGLGVRIVTIPEVLVKLHFEEQRPSLSGTGNWALSLNWLDDVRPLLTRRAYSGFCLVVVGPRAANQRAYVAFFPLLLKAFRHGSPRPLQLVAFLAFWILPQNLRRQLRATLGGGRRSARPPVTSDAPV